VSDKLNEYRLLTVAVCDGELVGVGDTKYKDGSAEGDVDMVG